MARDADHGLAPRLSVEDVLGDPAVSDAFKAVLRAWLRRDAVDAAKDAELFASVLGRRADPLLGRSS